VVTCAACAVHVSAACKALFLDRDKTQSNLVILQGVPKSGLDILPPFQFGVIILIVYKFYDKLKDLPFYIMPNHHPCDSTLIQLLGVRARERKALICMTLLYYDIWVCQPEIKTALRLPGRFPLHFLRSLSEDADTTGMGVCV
jgi:hypothetical protein